MKAPRELLWAIIISLVIALISLVLFPASSHHPTNIASSVSEFTEGYLGIKPGEGLLVLVTILLWWATRDLVKEGRRTSETQLRAYISVEPGASIVQSKKRGLRFEFRPVIINNGQTPAEAVRVVSNAGIVAPAIPSGFDYDQTATLVGASSTSLGPRQNKFHSAIYHRRATITELRGLRKGTLIFHVYGKVLYFDVFKKERETRFSFTIFLGKTSADAIWRSTDLNNNST